VIVARRLQRSFADGFIAEEVQDLWEPWMRHADEALNDDQLLQIIQQELSKRIKKSKTRGRPGTSAEVVLRMLLLKHMRGWSYEDVTREVRANLVYREFTGIGDPRTLGHKWLLACSSLISVVGLADIGFSSPIVWRRSGTSHW
jgi:transposase, IS5 family